LVAAACVSAWAVTSTESYRWSRWTTAAVTALDDPLLARLQECQPTLVWPALVQDLDWPCGEQNLVQTLKSAPQVDERRRWARQFCLPRHMWERRCLRQVGWDAALSDLDAVDDALVAHGAPPAAAVPVLGQLGLRGRLGPDEAVHAMVSGSGGDLSLWEVALVYVPGLPDAAARAEILGVASTELLHGPGASDAEARAILRARSACDPVSPDCAARLRAVAQHADPPWELPTDAPAEVFAREPWLDAIATVFGPAHARASAARLDAWRRWESGRPGRLELAAQRLWPDAPAAARAALRGEPLEEAGVLELAEWGVTEGHGLGARDLLTGISTGSDGLSVEADRY
jgi:hypothetical protein